MSRSPVLATLVAGLAFLEHEGFELAECTETASAASGRICNVQYRCAPARRLVSVTCFPDRQTARASIAATDRPFDFTDAGALSIRAPCYAEMPGAGLAKLENYLQALRRELLTTHLGILRGAHFANDAMDWSPYK